MYMCSPTPILHLGAFGTLLYSIGSEGQQLGVLVLATGPLLHTQGWLIRREGREDVILKHVRLKAEAEKKSGSEKRECTNASTFLGTFMATGSINPLVAIRL